MKIRTLTADEIDVRGQSVSKGSGGKIGVVLLLYKDARVDMKILDETFGICGWQRSHEVIDGNLYCTIKIRSQKGEWISKQDVGVESNTEKEKGQASDSFKRAAFNIGIGRELYTSPFVWVELDDKEYSQQGDKYKMSSWIKFYVMDIKYSEDNVITDLVIVDKNGKVRYSLKSPVVTKTQPKKTETLKNITTVEQAAALKITFGEYTAKPLGEIYKTDIECIKQLVKECSDETVLKAIGILKVVANSTRNG